MQTTILSKCVGELKKDAPNIQYVLGMLETLIDMAPQQNITQLYAPPIHNTVLPEVNQPAAVSATETKEETPEERALRKYLGN